MNETETISPAEGRRVLDPVRGHPIGDNETVAWSSYWQRRLDDGDVVLAGAQPAKTKKKGA
jgi:hypothetical protein